MKLSFFALAAEWLSTPANIEGQEKVCALLAPGDQSCATFSAQAVAKMRSVKPGNYAPQNDDGVISYTRLSPPELHQPARQPARVAVLVDNACASSCEEFLLAARQSFHVKLIGRNSYGALDYSNLRRHTLPSGVRQLQYATSRAQEIVRVQHWLEGGSLRPDSI